MLRKTLVGIIVAGLAMLLHRGWTELNKPGYFPLREIHLRGAVHTSAQKLKEAVDIPDGANLLKIDPAAVQERIKSLPWVRSLRVRRIFPNGLGIELQEKVAVCMGREGEKLVLIDEYGMPLKPLEPGDPVVLPVVSSKDVGKSSRLAARERPARIVGLINMLGKHRWLRNRISEAVELADNHWALNTRQGVRLLISQRGDEELTLLKRLQERHRILDRKVRQVELRIAGRVAVRAADVIM